MPTLLDLPNELLDAVIDQLPSDRDQHHYILGPHHKDLKSLRLACCDLELRTKIRFGKEFFGAIEVDLVTPKSLRRIDAVLDHTTLGESIKVLMIGIGPQHWTQTPSTPEDIAQWTEPPPGLRAEV